MAIKRRRLGRTGLMVGELGLGAMDTPTSPSGPATVARALQLGIDFIDTARGYAGSEFLLGEVLREHPNTGCTIASKTFSHTANGSQWDIDRSLRALGLPRIPLYQLHDIRTMADWEEVMSAEGALSGLQAARERGVIDHIGMSSHSEEVLRAAITSGEFATVMIEYSAFFNGTAPLIELAAERDIGVIVMRPLGGSGRTSVIRGRVAEGREGILTAANLLRYVLSHPGVSVAIPGARFPDRIEQNVEAVAAYEPMTDAERAAIEEEASRLYA